MQWTLLLGISFVGLAYYVFGLKKRIETLESQRGAGASFNYSIRALHAIMNHPKFAELIKLPSALKGKPFSAWTKEDKEKWFRSPVQNKSFINILYLPGEDMYVVEPSKQVPRIVYKDEGVIYNTVVLGDEDQIKERLELTVYSRIKRGVSYLTVALSYHEGVIGKEEFEILCELPVVPQLDDDSLRQLGFTVKRSGGDDFYEDSFGETQSTAMYLEIKKNGVEFNTSI